MVAWDQQNMKNVFLQKTRFKKIFWICFVLYSCAFWTVVNSFRETDIKTKSEACNCLYFWAPARTKPSYLPCPVWWAGLSSTSYWEQGHMGIMLELGKETSALKDKLAESNLRDIKLMAFQILWGWIEEDQGGNSWIKLKTFCLVLCLVISTSLWLEWSVGNGLRNFPHCKYTVLWACVSFSCYSRVEF